MARTKLAEISKVQKVKEEVQNKLAVEKDASTVEKKKKKRKDRKRWARQVRRIQSKTGPILPRTAVEALVREIAESVSSTGSVRFEKNAIEALRTIVTDYATDLMRDSFKVAVKNGRHTLQIEDMRIVKGIYASMVDRFKRV